MSTCHCCDGSCPDISILRDKCNTVRFHVDNCSIVSGIHCNQNIFTCVRCGGVQCYHLNNWWYGILCCCSITGRVIPADIARSISSRNIHNMSTCHCCDGSCPDISTLRDKCNIVRFHVDNRNIISSIHCNQNIFTCVGCGGVQ